MCGLIAFAGDVDPKMVQSLVDLARRRGPDNLGIAWVREDGNWSIQRWKISSWPEAFPVPWPTGCKAGVGHARLATSGSQNIIDAQPLLIGEMLFAHNGTVYGHDTLAARYQMNLTTENDSEVLGRLFQRRGYNADSAMRELEEHQGILRHAWIAALGGKIWLASWGQPLFYREALTAHYACSWRFPGSTEIPSRSVITWDL